ncbi:sel1 repeat family protein [Azospirillum brasilense]|uniref:Sel1 repeat family protein n=2 Tax=Azospirillum brasilense TaxID=192 RepID=A0A6L3B2E6_AZOBR|nr:sel1 repeat family protein [Azospirillum brasilense]
MGMRGVDVGYGAWLAKIAAAGTALAIAGAAGAQGLDAHALAAACANPVPTVEDEFRCGLAHYLGKGARADDAEAFRRFMRAAEGGHIEALNNLGQMHLDRASRFHDERKGFALLLQAAEKGYAKAQYSVALLLEEGHAARQDLALARSWYRKAAEQDHPFAQNNLANLLRWGTGGGRDVPEAARLYRRAAERGVPSAAFNLAELYLEGEGVPRDTVEAHLWFTRAAARGDKALKARIFDILGALEERMTDEERKAVANRNAQWRAERPVQNK